MRISLCLLALSSTLCALDAPPVITDVRLFGGWGQEGGQIKTTYHNVDPTIGDIPFEDADADLKFRFGLSFFGSLGGIDGLGAPVLGVSFMQLKSEVTDTRTGAGGAFITEPVDVTANVYSLHLGWAVGMGRHLHLEALAHGGYGTLNGTEHDLALTNVTTGETRVVNAHSGSNGTYWEVGGSLGAYYTFTCGAQLGLAVDAIHGQGRSSISSFKEQDGNVVTTNTFVGFSYEEEFEIDTVIGYISFGLRL